MSNIIELAQAPSQQDITDYETWDAEQVASYFEGLGYGEYRDVFLSNGLSGDRVVLMTNEDVPDLGIEVIGDRVGLLKALQTLKAKARLQLARVEIHREEEAFHSCLIAEKFYTCFGICPRDPDQYILKASKLQIKEFELTRICGTFKCTCLGGAWHNDNISLDRIKDVDTVVQTTGMCCCKIYKSKILIAVSAGADAEEEDARVVQKELFVEGDKGEEFAEKILNQAEDYIIRLRGM